MKLDTSADDDLLKRMIADFEKDIPLYMFWLNSALF